MPKLQQQGIVHIGLILLLLAGLIAGVYLVQHPQIFKPKAAGGKIWLIDESGNTLPQKYGGVYEVPSQQIRIYINQPTVWSPLGSSSRPQSRLPNLVTAAYAQTSPCNGTVYSCSDIKCDDDSTAPGTGCYETGGDLNNRYRTECLRNCPTSSTTGGTGSSGTTTNTGTTADVSTPTITGASWDKEGNYLTITGTNFGNSGSVYYSKGGSEQIPSQSVNSWSAGSVKIGAEIPLGSTKSVENMISGGNYLKVCRTDGKCSSFWSPIPDRPKFEVYIPTAPNAAPQGQGAPAAPTQEKVTEVTQEIRISSVIGYVAKDGVCEGNEDPVKHCMRLTGDNPDSGYTFAALLTKGYISWQLANTTEDQNVYVGFISNKGQNFFQSIRVRIVKSQPAQGGQPAAGGAGGAGVSPTPSPRPVSPTPSPTAKPPCRDKVGVCVKDTGDDRGLYSESDFLCSGKYSTNLYSCPSSHPICLTDYNCKAPCPTLTGVCVNEEYRTSANDMILAFDGAGTKDSWKYFCSNPAYPICLTGDTPSISASAPSPSPSPDSDALPITGKVKIIANGRTYVRVEVAYYNEDYSGPVKYTSLGAFLPSNQDQEVSYRIESLKRNTRTRVRASVSVSETSGSKTLLFGVDSSKNDCQNRDSYDNCLVAEGSTQNFTVTLPASKVNVDSPEGSPENPDPYMIYVKNNSDQKVTVQKVEQLTSEPVFSFWFVQIGAEYTQLDCKPESAVLSSKQYASCEAIVIACSRSDMENKKEKEVKVKYAIGEGSFDSATGQTGKVVQIATGRYQCGGAGLVNIP